MEIGYFPAWWISIAMSSGRGPWFSVEPESLARRSGVITSSMVGARALAVFCPSEVRHRTLRLPHPGLSQYLLHRLGH